MTASVGDSGPELSYEQARDELSRIVAQLEAGGITLEESLALWERGERLAKICDEFLTAARARLDAANGATTSGEQPPHAG
ncbi:MAG: exodeoxyribonuclease VII small subunit [Jiangellaceae bacterium]|nr:exodeoxyribonuclease VII small subunit [Jiangellaceae bacterium]